MEKIIIIDYLFKEINGKWWDLNCKIKKVRRPKRGNMENLSDQTWNFTKRPYIKWSKCHLPLHMPTLNQLRRKKKEEREGKRGKRAWEREREGQREKWSLLHSSTSQGKETHPYYIEFCYCCCCCSWRFGGTKLKNGACKKLGGNKTMHEAWWRVCRWVS